MKKDYNAEIKELTAKLSKNSSILAIYLFGSYARGDYDSGSDIDVLVKPLKGADLFSFGGLSVFLERKFGRKVDVVPERNIRKELKDAILSEVIRI